MKIIYTIPFLKNLGNFYKKMPLFEILSPRILLQIYPFLSETMNECGVIFALPLYQLGLKFKANQRKNNADLKETNQEKNISHLNLLMKNLIHNSSNLIPC